LNIRLSIFRLCRKIFAFLTGGLGLGIIFIMEYFRKKIKENTGKENELLFIILGLIIYMIYQF